nr:phage tail assembly protein [uncultured Desulfobacter sp.]
MRKTKSIKIDDLEITLKELRVKDIRQILNRLSDLSGVEDAMELLPMVTDLPAEKLEEMAPSELNQVWEAAKEVNAFFLSLLEKSGVITALKDSIQASLTELFAELSRQDMSTALDTDSPSS